MGATNGKIRSTPQLGGAFH